MRVRFDGFVLDTATRELVGGAGPVHLPPKAFDLLQTLAERRPAVVPRAELEKRVWGSTHVSETSLASLVAELRKALGDQGRPARFIRTAHGFGYAFSATVAEGLAAPRAAGVAHRLLHDRREIDLREGENILGRETGAVAWLDSASVSRRHARIVVEGAAATLEDLGSRNGTQVNGRPVTGPVVLADGDEIGLGAVRLTFRVVPAGATETHG